MAKLTRHKNGKYYVSYYDADKGYTRKESTHTGYKKAAQEYFNRWQIAKASGEPAKHVAKFSDILDAYLAYLGKKDPTGHRVALYRSKLFKFPAITTQAIEEYKEERLGKVTPRTVHNELAIVKAALNFAKKMGMISEVPYILMPSYSRKKNKERFIPKETVNSLCNRAPNGWIWTILLYTGIRPPSEIMRLKWKHVKNTYISVPEAKAASRTVPMAKKVKEVLQYRKKFCVDASPNERVIPFRHKDTLGKWWKRDCKKLDISGWRMYDCRHTCGSLLLENGASIVEVSKILGNSVAICQQVYAHVYPDRLGSVIALVDQDEELA